MPAVNPEQLVRAEDAKSRQETLALLYQSIFTAIVRLQSGRQRLDPLTFRRRIREALQDISKEAAAAGYNSRTVRDAESAIVAFLDETVLSLSDPARDDWAKQPLYVELYGEGNAGEAFFDRLDELQGETDTPLLGNVLEVYLLCLLLGFEGRYSGSLRTHGFQIADRLRAQIEGIRDKSYKLSPPFRYSVAPAAPGPVTHPDSIGRWRLLAVATAPFLLFGLYKLNLLLLVEDFRSMLEPR